MANNQAPNGFSFVRNYYSAAPTYQTSVYQISSTNANSFGKGDVVKGLSTGFIDRSLTSDTVFLGVLDRIEYFDSTLQAKQFRNAWLAPSSALAGSVLAYVIDDPNAVFGAQVGGSASTGLAYADVNTNINFGGNAAPNTKTGISVAYADQSTLATTATLPFRVVNVPQNLGGNPVTAGPIGNDSTAAYNYAEFLLNASQIKSTTGV